MLDPVKELDLGRLGVQLDHPWVACFAGAGVLQVSAHLQMGKAGILSLDTGDSHNVNTA